MNSTQHDYSTPVRLIFDELDGSVLRSCSWSGKAYRIENQFSRCGYEYEIRYDGILRYEGPTERRGYHYFSLLQCSGISDAPKGLKLMLPETYTKSNNGVANPTMPEVVHLPHLKYDVIYFDIRPHTGGGVPVAYLTLSIGSIDLSRLVFPLGVRFWIDSSQAWTIRS